VFAAYATVLLPTPEDALDLPNVVLVHGGFVDGSGWQGSTC
jgi:hypothetical protein